jgi:rubrerythrin
MTETGGSEYSYSDLSELEQLNVDAMRALYKIEMSGKAFYDALAERIGNDEVAVLLRRNGREEAGHARRLGRAIALKLGTDFEPTPDMVERAEVRLPEAMGANYLPSLVQLELDGEPGYRRWADHEPDPAVARLLLLNGREEALHAERVKAAMAILGIAER